MLLKLAALGAVGYAGYKYLQSKSPETRTPDIRLAGGPLSSEASVQRTPDYPSSI
ncbi:MAG: hypothetical protein V4533_13410 [Pseudomonadota bacterium]